MSVNRLSLCPDAKTVVQELLVADEDKSILIACLLWRWWTRRNKLNAKEKTGAHGEIVSQVRYWAGEENQYCRKLNSERTPAEEPVWQHPVGDRLKINIDGSYTAKTRTGGWGFALRDQLGRLRGSGAGRLPYVVSAAQAQARRIYVQLRPGAWLIPRWKRIPRFW
jgi:hypothetical protein